VIVLVFVEIDGALARITELGVTKVRIGNEGVMLATPVPPLQARLVQVIQRLQIRRGHLQLVARSAWLALRWFGGPDGTAAASVSALLALMSA
jgi:hypothetical protein